jgi:transcriptional regulator with XRE-family HTH domain
VPARRIAADGEGEPYGGLGASHLEARDSVVVMPTASTNKLGEFLRAHRARLDPADVGLRGGGDRRVAGLRREEVAVLAGVSIDYYTRLEQGRERNPSAQVLDAIGRALKLNIDARGHIFRLAGLNPHLAPGSSRDLVHPALLQLLDSSRRSSTSFCGPLPSSGHCGRTRP